jgi:hypothetical protein
VSKADPWQDLYGALTAPIQAASKGVKLLQVPIASTGVLAGVEQTISVDQEHGLHVAPT